MVSGVVIKSGNVGFSIEVEADRGPNLEPLRKEAEDRIRQLPGVLSVTAVLTAHRAGGQGPANLKKNNDDWFMYYPCGYTNAEKEIKTIKILNKDQKIFMIDGCDYIVSKLMLWYILEKTYGRNVAGKILPRSYLSYKLNDMIKFWYFYKKKMKKNKSSIFILKNDKQRQEGINLLRKKKDIFKLISKGR